MKHPLLELKGLNKIFPGGLHAVVDLNFKLNEGEICAFLGPNGAGKSTSISMICGLSIPSRGEVFFESQKVNHKSMAYRRAIGVVSQHSNLEIDLSVKENLLIHGLLYDLSRAEIRQRIDQFLDLVQLKTKMNTPVRKLSGGMRRKVQLARVLLHDPKLLILDEPTVGLDPASRKAIWDILVRLNQHGKTLFFSTHYMDEAYCYAGRVAILHQGRIIADGTPNHLVETLGKWNLVHNGSSTRAQGTAFYHSRQAAAEAVVALEKAGQTGEVRIRRTSLEDVFISLTGENLSDYPALPVKETGHD
jgi:ABC-2 type transport system ATP-binding protein